MAQHDYVIANGTGAAVRSDLNNALAAIVTQNSGPTAPATTYAYQWWADTSTGLLKLRNAANNAWITLRELDGTLTIEDGTASSPGLAFADDLNTGIYSPSADQLGITTGGTVRLTTTTTGITSALPVDVPLGTASAPTVTFTGDLNTGIYSPGADQVAISTNGSGRLFVDASGRVLVGTSTTQGKFYNGSNVDHSLQIETTTAYGQSWVSHGTSAGFGAHLTIGRSRGTSAGSVTVVQVDDSLGHFSFQGADGTEFVEAAKIQAFVDGTPGANDMPGRIVLSTTADGASSPTERMRIDSSGRVGIGTTSPGVTLHLNATNPGIRLEDSDASGTPFAEIFGSSGNLILQADAGAEIASSNIQFLVDGNEAARIDDSRRLLVGTSSNLSLEGFGSNLQIEATTFTASQSIVRHGGVPAIRLGRSGGSTIGSTTLVASGDDLGTIRFIGADGSDFDSIAAQITCAVDGTPGANDMPGRLVFSVTQDGSASPTERLRIDNLGNTTNFCSGQYGLVTKTSSAAGTTNYLILGSRDATSVTSGTTSYAVYSNGNVQNTNGSYTTLSDAKLKENIVDAGSQWNDLKAIQIRHWNFKAETGHETHRQIGPIAQELETVCPGLVFETPDRDEDGNETGEVTKGVNQSVLYMKAVKALQEAMERIEQLEAEMAEVKAQLS